MKPPWTRSELGYCTNVHPGETLQQVLAVIQGPLCSVRQNRHLSSMAAGLWLSDATAHALCSDDNLAPFSELLNHHGISLNTLNGFPIQGFHSARVKQAVYHPDWSEPERLAYTLRLAHILALLLPPEQAEGTISSVPLGFASDWNAQRNTLALDALCHCISELETIHSQSGRRIRLCLEMEPGCVLESTDQLIAFFNHELADHVAQRDLDPSLIQNYLGICFDVCHQAVMFEDCYQSLSRIRAADIHIGKIQISSALELNATDPVAARVSLTPFIEPKYLHQACCRDDHGRLLKVMDLDQAFNRFPATSPWRVHFHVPIQIESLNSQGLATTQREIGCTLDFLRDHPDFHPHLEVETYTWSALPEPIRPKNDAMIVQGLSAELGWLERQMQLRGLIPLGQA